MSASRLFGSARAQSIESSCHTGFCLNHPAVSFKDLLVYYTYYLFIIVHFHQSYFSINPNYVIFHSANDDQNAYGNILCFMMCNVF